MPAGPFGGLETPDQIVEWAVVRHEEATRVKMMLLERLSGSTDKASETRIETNDSATGGVNKDCYAEV